MPASDSILYERFQKNGQEYECIISPTGEHLRYAGLCTKFQVTLKLEQDESLKQFSLFSMGDGHWMPDDRNAIDPWLADSIGRIIVENF